jgi:hypothetical protein
MSELFTEQEREVFEGLVSGEHVNAVFLEKAELDTPNGPLAVNVIVAVLEKSPSGELLTAPMAVLVDEQVYSLLSPPEGVTEVSAGTDEIEDFLSRFRGEADTEDDSEDTEPGESAA